MCPLAIHPPSTGELAIIFLIVASSLVLPVIAMWRIFAKAGYSGALALLYPIPIAGLVVLLVVAFSKWPLERRVNQGGCAGPYVP